MNNPTSISFALSFHLLEASKPFVLATLRIVRARTHIQEFPFALAPRILWGGIHPSGPKRSRLRARGLGFFLGFGACGFGCLGLRLWGRSFGESCGFGGPQPKVSSPFSLGLLFRVLEVCSRGLPPDLASKSHLEVILCQASDSEALARLRSCRLRRLPSSPLHLKLLKPSECHAPAIPRSPLALNKTPRNPDPKPPKLGSAHELATPQSVLNLLSEP